jgi:phosphate transport system substrate-binding protein
VIRTRTRLIAAWAIGATAALTLAACSSSSGGGGSSSAADSGSSSGSASASAAAIQCASGSLKGEGSTAQTNAITQWITDYQTKCSGATVAYNATGSGAGRTNFIAGQDDFAGSDAALSAAEQTTAAARCGGNPALDLPMVIGPIAVAYNVTGLKDITLTPDVLSKIFLGSITTWNDPAIKAINSGATLPSTAIKVFFRSDASGTTSNFTNYLNTAAPASFPTPAAQAWPGAVGEGKKGSDGVQQAVTATDGAIGYMEYSFAENANLKTAKIDNGGGAVALTTDAASKAIASAAIVGTGSDLALKIDYATKTPGAYPIVLATYEIVCSKGLSTANAALVKSFLTYTSGAGQKGLSDLGYAPLPASIATKVQAAVASLS